MRGSAVFEYVVCSGMPDKKYLHLAKQLRKNQTGPETKLWAELRNRRLAGFKFKSQVPIGSFIVDFMCEEKKLIVEIDGSNHEGKRAEDTERTEVLQSMGYLVWRVWNIEVDEHLDDVLNALLHELETI